MSKRIDKHELKHDKFVDDITKFYRNVRSEPRKALIYVGIAVAIVIIILSFLSYRKARKKAAEERLGIAYILLAADQYQASFDTLRSLVNHYGSSPQARDAVYLLGHLYYSMGFLDSAIASYQKFLTFNEPDSDIIAAAIMGLASAYEDKSQIDVASEHYKKILDGYPNFFRADEAMIGIARCFEIKNKPFEAKNMYREFLHRFPNSEHRNRVIVLLTRIESNFVPDIEQQQPQTQQLEVQRMPK